MGSQRMIRCACCGSRGRLAGRGLIERCETRLRRHGEGGSRALFPRQTRPAAEMLDDYATWRARWPQATQQEIADEMGVTRSALRRALDRDRARARNEPDNTEETTMSWFQDAFRSAMQPIWDSSRVVADNHVDYDTAGNYVGFDATGMAAGDKGDEDKREASAARHIQETDASQEQDYAERGPDIGDYLTSEEEDNWNNFRETPNWALYPDEYRGHEYNQAKDDWAGRSPTAEDVEEAHAEAIEENDYLDALAAAPAGRGVVPPELRGPDTSWQEDPANYYRDQYVRGAITADEYEDAAASRSSVDPDAWRDVDRERELQEDIDVGAVPVKYTDTGVWLGEDFYSHDSLLSNEPDRGAAWVREDEDAVDESPAAGY
jgi:hypothetical protein